MGSFSDNYIESYESKIQVYHLYRMYQEGRLVFPSNLTGKRAKKIEVVSETLEAILLGIILPIIYASERQDGSLLVLDASSRLQYLMEFLEGDYPVMGLEFYPELNGCRLERLEQQFPRITSLLYDYRISFQIIEYTNPKYMHMQTGNYIERWNFVREQEVRNALYGKELEKCLMFLEVNLGQSGNFFSRQSLNRQYMVLRILMYRFVFEDNIRLEHKEHAGIQLLLDRTAQCLRTKDRMWEQKIADDFRTATERLTHWGEKADFNLAREKGKEWQAKTLGYLYNVVWMCRKKGYQAEWGLERIAFDEPLWEHIDREKVSYGNIRKHYYEIERRLRPDAEPY